MKPENEICLKFPSVLREKLIKNELELPDDTLFSYDKICAYRLVEREKNDWSEVNANDFKSYFELGKKPKSRPRGVSVDYEKMPDYYGVSIFTDMEEMKQRMHFPRPSLKVSEGYVCCESGPIYPKGAHICWWLYENADISSFKIIKEVTNNE